MNKRYIVRQESGQLNLPYAVKDSTLKSIICWAPYRPAADKIATALNWMDEHVAQTANMVERSDRS